MPVSGSTTRSLMVMAIIFISFNIWAQTGGNEPSPSAAGQAAQPATPATADNAPAEQPPAEVARADRPAEAHTPGDATRAEEDTGEKAGAKADSETPEKEGGEPAMPAGESMVLITDRLSIGMLGADMVAEYGIQGEIMSKHFGVTARWAVFQPYPDKVGFCYDFGFAFHYYPFANGPSGLYVGPGFMLMHMFRNPDPIPDALATHEIHTGYGEAFDFLTPIAEVGYRHRFPFYLTLGAELTAGYAFSDRTSQWDSGFYWTINPQVGLSW